MQRVVVVEHKSDIVVVIQNEQENILILPVLLDTIVIAATVENLACAKQRK